MTSRIMLVGNEHSKTERILVKEGYRVYLTSKDVVAEACSKSPEVIIFLNHTTKDLNVCASLQKYKKTRDIPLVILSPKRNRQSTILALQVGCIDFIEESIQISLLLSKIRTYLRISKIRSICSTLQTKLLIGEQNDNTNNSC